MSTMKNAHDRIIDHTFLSIFGALNQCMIHRDYLAHCFRWSHVIKYLTKNRKEGIRVVEIGCGKELPFAHELVSDADAYEKIDYPAFRAIRSHRLIADTQYYVGVDIADLQLSEYLSGNASRGKIITCGNTKFSEFGPANLEELLLTSPRVDPEHASLKPNVIICNEVAEHMPHEEWLATLAQIMAHCDEDTTVFVSTPAFSGQAAKNHVNEYTFEAFGAIVEDAGFGFPLKETEWPVQAPKEFYQATIWGTFAQQRNVLPALEESIGKEAYDKIVSQLKQYYDPNVLSIIFAPLFPDQASNVMWEFTKAPDKYKRYFPDLKDVEKPWGSGWKENPFSNRGQTPEAKDKMVQEKEALSDGDVSVFLTTRDLCEALIKRGLATSQAWLIGSNDEEKPTTIMELYENKGLADQHPGVTRIRFISKALVEGQSMNANLLAWAMDLSKFQRENPTKEETDPEQPKKKVDLTASVLIGYLGDAAATTFVNVEAPGTDHKFIGLLSDMPEEMTVMKLHNVSGQFVPPGKPMMEGSLLDFYKVVAGDNVPF